MARPTVSTRLMIGSSVVVWNDTGLRKKVQDPIITHHTFTSKYAALNGRAQLSFTLFQLEARVDIRYISTWQ